MNLPTPAIVPQSAVRRLPRWALLLLCLAYIVPGFVGRDPWRGADMAATGYMLELAQERSSWWAPLLGGMPPDTDGLLPYWMGAWAMQLAPSGISPELAARLPFAALLALTLVATWYGVYCLARSPGAQPVAFAFGGEAQPRDYARAMADGGLLALLACLGLAQPSHEATSYLTQLCCTALVFFALAAAPYRTAAPLLALVAGLAGLVLSGAPALALLYALGGAALCLCSPASSGQPQRQLRAMGLVLLAAALAAAVLAWSLQLWRWRIDSAYDDPSEWASFARLLLWFCWPAWPLALWTLWRWRKQIASRQLHRHLLLPLWFALVAVAAAFTTQPSDRALLLGLPAMATLAAFALPTLRRSVAALIDWFTLLFFSASAIAIWVVWTSTQTGVPAQPAANVAKLAPGFVPEFSAFTLAVALAATAAWCALVAWRTGRHRAAIWKSLVLPAAGATLGWLLLLTLWLPMLNYARSDAPQVQSILQVVGQPPCVLGAGLNRSQIAALRYHGKLIVQPAEGTAHCPWLLVADRRTPSAPSAGVDGQQWTLAAQLARPTDRSDFIWVYRRSSP
ncbi:hypothetical protein B2J88_10690 [Rhodococcus sp. SRB_17]|uniref:hypothetical protein n=1 Tax=Acidovorax sp. SRB_24 TaxID=1962700 RepID=UPI00145CE941|nr:hypothetical protein [Acidovorax sp. SRB_24]NMM84830.1 hypothetical protein [Rhodococcus sp. SRB_17]